MYQMPNLTNLFYFFAPMSTATKSKYLSSENIRNKLQQMSCEMEKNIRSEMKEMKERLDTLTASLEENKDEGQL